MGERTAIEWCDHSWSPWWGCQRVSPGCEHCYAESFAARVGHGKRLPTIWGPPSKSERRFFGESHWGEPLRWNRKAQREGVRRRVFCASMCDAFEDRPELVEPRARTMRLIEDTPALDWLLLTKRPENMRLLTPGWGGSWPRNVWAGTTCEDQQRANERVPILGQIPAAVRFVSYEPALGPLDIFSCAGMEDTCRLDWVIVGGESGPRARPFDIAWARSTISQCREAGVACFVKQLGSNPHGEWGDTNRPKVMVTTSGGDSRIEEHRCRNGRWRLRDRKGGTPSEWPSDLRVREFPEMAA